MKSLLDAARFVLTNNREVWVSHETHFVCQHICAEKKPELFLSEQMFNLKSLKSTSFVYAYLLRAHFIDATVKSFETFRQSITLFIAVKFVQPKKGNG